MEYEVRTESCNKYFPPFFSDLKRECIERFRKPPNARIIKDDDQICTTDYSRIIPLENGEVKYKLVKQQTLQKLLGSNNNLVDFKPLHRSDCGFSDQRSARVQKLHLLTRAARLHEGHEHPPAFPPHQHPAGPPDLQGPERPHRHTQGETQTVQTHTEVSCWRNVIPPFGQAKHTASYLRPASLLSADSV